MKFSYRTLWAAAGFGIGGAIGGIWFKLDNPAFPIVFGIMGAFGSASLGLLLRSWKYAAYLALAGLIGFSLSWLPLAFSLMGVADQSSLTENPGFLVFGTLGLLINGAFQGVIGTVPILFVLRHRKGAVKLIITGAAGFALASLVSLAWAMGLDGSASAAIWGMIGGTFLGSAIEQLDRTDI